MELQLTKKDLKMGTDSENPKTMDFLDLNKIWQEELVTYKSPTGRIIVIKDRKGQAKRLLSNPPNQMGDYDPQSECNF